MGVCKSDLVGADDEHDAVHVGLRAHFLFHLAEPAVESVETLPEADIVNQQHALTVLIELIPHLTHTHTHTPVREEGTSFFWFNSTSCWHVSHITVFDL